MKQEIIEMATRWLEDDNELVPEDLVMEIATMRYNEIAVALEPVRSDWLGDADLLFRSVAQQLAGLVDYVHYHIPIETVMLAKGDTPREAASAVRHAWDEEVAKTEAARAAAVARRIESARFPVIKTLDTFWWEWPEKINRLQIQDLFDLRFIEDHANVILLGTVGLGKTHLATALGYAACQEDMSVLFANTIDVINTLRTAQTQGNLKAELRKYTDPALLILDEFGYLPVDQCGADLLFQIVSARYERGSIILTTNKAFKQWPSIFNGDSSISAVVLDRLLHHGHTVVLEGTSYRMKGRAESSSSTKSDTCPSTSAEPTCSYVSLCGDLKDLRQQMAELRKRSMGAEVQKPVESP